RVQLWAFVGGWLLIVVIAVLLHHLSPDTVVLPYAISLLYGLGFGVASYSLGHFTSLFTGVTMIGGGTIGFVLFERRVVLLGIISYVSIIVATTIGEQLGLLRYAPVFSGSPVNNGRLSGFWLATIGGLTMVVIVAVLALIDYIVRQWREYQRKLEQTAE